MDHHHHAEHLMSDARRGWQDPVAILKSVGIEKGMTVADLGCGPGFFTVPLASIVGREGTVYAVDASPEVLERLRESLKLEEQRWAVRIMQADVSRTAVPTSSVDVAFFANVLHDIVDKAAFFGEVKRICRPGGSAADIDWKKTPTEYGPPLEIRLTEDESRRLLSENGFKFVRRIDAGPYHYGLVCRLSA